MARVTVEDCLDKVHNRFALVVLVAKRTKQLMKGVQSVVQTKSNKFVVTSLREVAAGKVNFDYDQGRGTADQQIQEDLNR